MHCSLTAVCKAHAHNNEAADASDNLDPWPGKHPRGHSLQQGRRQRHSHRQCLAPCCPPQLPAWHHGQLLPAPSAAQTAQTGLWRRRPTPSQTAAASGAPWHHYGSAPQHALQVCSGLYWQHGANVRVVCKHAQTLFNSSLMAGLVDGVLPRVVQLYRAGLC